MYKTISISDWHLMALEGTAPPMHIMLNGCSMEPLIRLNRDYVTIVPLEANLVVGDIVLFSDIRAGRYVVHRIWKMNEEEVLTWGDNCLEPDGWCPMDAIWGKVILIERGKRIIHPDPRKGLRWAKFWHKVRPGYDFCWRTKNALVHRIIKLKE